MNEGDATHIYPIFPRERYQLLLFLSSATTNVTGSICNGDKAVTEEQSGGNTLTTFHYPAFTPLSFTLVFVRCGRAQLRQIRHNAVSTLSTSMH